MARLERITAALSDLETVGEPTAERFEREPIPRFATERILIALVDLAPRRPLAPPALPRRSGV
jgi:hypothetical protein